MKDPLKIKFIHDQRVDFKHHYRKIRRWVIIAVLLNICVVTIHLLSLWGYDLKSMAEHTLSPTPSDSTDTLFNFDHEPYYYAGHSYSSDSIIDTLGMNDHMDLMEQLIPGDTKDGVHGYYGIDVSHWQNSIDWATVQKDVSPHKMDFFIIKATQGATGVDSYFHHNWKEARTEHSILGAYHFFSYSDDPIQQAQNYIKNVQFIKGDLRPIVDVELACKSCKTKQAKASLIQNLTTFISEIEKHYKVQPIIYTYSYFYQTYLSDHFKKYSFWMAQYSSTPPKGMQIHEGDTSMVRPPSVYMWQFTSKGRMDGIVGNVDMSFAPSIDFLKLRIP